MKQHLLIYLFKKEKNIIKILRRQLKNKKKRKEKFTQGNELINSFSFKNDMNSIT